MLTNSSLILILFILPEVKDFSKLKSQISVTANNSRPAPFPLNLANSLLVQPDNSDLQTFLQIDHPENMPG